MDTPHLLSRTMLIFHDHWRHRQLLQTKLDNIPNKPHSLSLAIAHQLDIGCDLFPLGLISSSFGTTYETLWDPYQGPKSISASQWIKKIIHFCIHMFRDLWKLRCSTQHDEQKDTLEIAYRTELKTYSTKKSGVIGGNLQPQIGNSSRCQPASSIPKPSQR